MASVWIVECLGYVNLTPSRRFESSAALGDPVLSSPGGAVSLVGVDLLLDGCVSGVLAGDVCAVTGDGEVGLS